MSKRLSTEEKTRLYSDMFGGEPGVDFVIQVDEEVSQVTEAEARALRDENAALKRRIAELEAAAAGSKRSPKKRAADDDGDGDEAGGQKAAPRALAAAAATDDTGESLLSGPLYQAIRRRLLEDPTVLRMLAVKPELRVEVERVTIEAEYSTIRGRLAELIAVGFFKVPTKGSAAHGELARRGFSTAQPNVYRELDKLAQLGFPHEGGGWLPSRRRHGGQRGEEEVTDWTPPGELETTCSRCGKPVRTSLVPALCHEHYLEWRAREEVTLHTPGERGRALRRPARRRR